MDPPFNHSEKSIRGDSSDIGGFSLLELFLEGIRRSRARGLCEHGNKLSAELNLADVFKSVRKDKHAEFAEPRKTKREWRMKSDWSESIPN